MSCVSLRGCYVCRLYDQLFRDANTTAFAFLGVNHAAQQSTTPHPPLCSSPPRRRHRHICVYVYIGACLHFMSFILIDVSHTRVLGLSCCAVIVSFKGSNDTQVRTDPTFVYRLLYTKNFPLPLSIPPQSPIPPFLFYLCTNTLLLCMCLCVSRIGWRI